MSIEISKHFCRGSSCLQFFCWMNNSTFCTLFATFVCVVEQQAAAHGASKLKEKHVSLSSDHS